MILLLILFKVVWVLIQASMYLLYWVALGGLFLVWTLFSFPFRFIGGLVRS